MVFPIIGVILGAAMAGASAAGAASSNKSIKRRVRELQVRLNKQMTQVQIEMLDQVRRRSTIGTMAIAQARSQFGYQRTGLSISERLASLAAALTVDTDAINFAEDARLDALRTEKLELVRGGEAAQTNVAVAGLQGFVSGFSTGLSLDSSLAQLSFGQAQVSNFSTLSSLLGGVSQVQMLAFPRSFEANTIQLQRMRLDTDLKLSLTEGIESFLNSRGF